MSPEGMESSLRTMKLLDYLIPDIKMIVRLVLHDCRKLDVICTEIPSRPAASYT